MGLTWSTTIYHLASAGVKARIGAVKHIWPKEFYDPLPTKGVHGRTAHPSMRQNTYMPVSPKHVQRFFGMPENHYAGKQEFIDLWEQRKRGSYYNVEVKHQLDDYHRGHRWEQRGSYYGTGVKSSREPQGHTSKPTFFSTATMAY